MITDSFNNSKPIVTLEAIYGKQKHILDKCVVIFSKNIYEYMLNNFECKKNR